MNITNELRQEYLEKHLPYRLNSMLSPDLMTHRRGTQISAELKSKCYSDSLVLEPAFEISIIFGRALLNFLGITLDLKTNELKRLSPRTDDLTVIDIYPEGNFCPLDDPIVVDNKESLSIIIRIANKSVAHLTSTLSNPNELAMLERARFSIYQLILKYVPDINKHSAPKKTGIWWYEQVENC